MIGVFIGLSSSKGGGVFFEVVVCLAFTETYHLLTHPIFFLSPIFLNFFNIFMISSIQESRKKL